MHEIFAGARMDFENAVLGQCAIAGNEAIEDLPLFLYESNPFAGGPVLQITTRWNSTPEKALNREFRYGFAIPVTDGKIPHAIAVENITPPKANERIFRINAFNYMQNPAMVMQNTFEHQLEAMHTLEAIAGRLGEFQLRE